MDESLTKLKVLCVGNLLEKIKELVSQITFEELDSLIVSGDPRTIYVEQVRLIAKFKKDIERPDVPTE